LLLLNRHRCVIYILIKKVSQVDGVDSQKYFLYLMEQTEQSSLYE